MAKAKITSVAQTDKAGLFSICFDGESFDEFQKFIINHKDAYSEDLNTILVVLQRMLEASGFLERYFRPEGKMRDGVCALPLQSGKLRLYCLRLSDSVLIAGNGGVKSTKTYNQDPVLSGYVVTLQNLDQAIKLAVKKGDVKIEERSITNLEKNYDL